MLSTSSVREIPTKTTRYHIIPTRVAKIKKAKNNSSAVYSKVNVYENLKCMSTQSLAIQTFLIVGKYGDSPNAHQVGKGTKYMIVRQLNIICQLKEIK